MIENSQVIQELNKFLEGNYIGINAYERYINHITDEKIKKVLQDIQKDHKLHVIRIAERIQNLGGIPVDDTGFKGNMIDFTNLFKKASSDAHFIIRDALKGEDQGIVMSEKLVRGDLDLESRQLVEEILDHDRKHLNQLNKYLH